MNLKQMVDKCAFALNYAPENEEYENEIIAELNDRYEEVSTQHPWLFLIRKETLDARAAIEGDSSKKITVDTGTNPYLVTASAGAPFVGSLAGQTFIGPDGVERTIVRRSSSTTIYVEPKFTSDINDSSDWSIIFRVYPYPPFATEVLGITSRSDDRGKLRYINWSAEEAMFLDFDQQGTPDFYIEDVHLMLDAPEDNTTIDDSGAGSLVEGLTYQYCYTIVGKGLESPPSHPVELEVTSSKAITLHRLRDLNDPDGDHDRGYRKQIYRRNKSRNGRWAKLGNAQGSGSTSYVDDGSAEPSFDPSDTLYEYGPRPFHRFWATPAETIELEVRYQLRPRKMQASTDTPMWPVEYHKLIVWEALVQLCLAHGMPQQSAMYQRRADLVMRKMKSRYLTRRDRKYVRKSFDHGRYEYEERYGVPRKI